MKIILTTTLFLTMPFLARAHEVTMNWKLNDGKVVVEVLFDGDFPGAYTKVKVLDDKKNVVSEGKTNDDGKWTFPAPKPGDYVLHADAGEGHRATEKMAIPQAPNPTASGGPIRGSRWLKVMIGVVTIGVLALAAFIALRVNRQRSTEGESNPASA